MTICQNGRDLLYVNLLNKQIINGGTAYADNPDDINMYLSDIKTPYDMPENDAEMKKDKEYAKQLVSSVVRLILLVTVLGFALAFFCVYKGFLGALPWIATLESAAWALGIVCAFYLNMAKSDHKAGGITYELAKGEGKIKDNEYYP